MFTLPNNPSLLFLLFTGLTFLGSFTLLKMIAGFIFDAVRKVEGRFQILLLLTPLLMLVVWLSGLFHTMNLWVSLAMVLLISVIEAGVVFMVQKDELKISQVALFILPTNILFFFLSYFLTITAENAYLTQFDFHIVMAFTVYLVSKLLLSVLYVFLSKTPTRVSLYMALSLAAITPLLWIAFEQNFAFMYMVVTLVYVTLFEALGLFFLLRKQPQTRMPIPASVVINVVTSVGILLLIAQEYVGQGL